MNAAMSERRHIALLTPLPKMSYGALKPYIAMLILCANYAMTSAATLPGVQKAFYMRTLRHTLKRRAMTKSRCHYLQRGLRERYVFEFI